MDIEKTHLLESALEESPAPWVQTEKDKIYNLIIAEAKKNNFTVEFDNREAGWGEYHEGAFDLYLSGHEVVLEVIIPSIFPEDVKFRYVNEEIPSTKRKGLPLLLLALKVVTVFLAILRSRTLGWSMYEIYYEVPDATRQLHNMSSGNFFSCETFNGKIQRTPSRQKAPSMWMPCSI